jgi:Uma2 family endonuclease
MSEVGMSTATIQQPVPEAANVPVDADELFEIVNGKRVGLPPMGIYASVIATRLVYFLVAHARAHDLGQAVSEGLFHLPLSADRNRRPDVAFVSYERWAKGRHIPESDNAWDVLPNLVVEVVSPTDLAERVHDKVAEYFRAGVTSVWVVYPQQQQIYVYESPTSIRVLTRADELDGSTVLPSFRLPLSELFTEPKTYELADDR